MRILTSHEENFVAGGLINNSGNNNGNNKISNPGQKIVGNVVNGENNGRNINSGNVINGRIPRWNWNSSIWRFFR